jgi:hypothetical protein
MNSTEIGGQLPELTIDIKFPMFLEQFNQAPFESNAMQENAIPNSFPNVGQRRTHGREPIF